MTLSRRTLLQVLALGGAAAAASQCPLIQEPEAQADPDDGKDLPRGRIAVRRDVAAGEVSPMIFGASLEWTDHGTFVFDPERNRLRPDVLDVLRPLRIPVFRFPGGILADHYHWRDAIGPPASRPRRRNPMDNSEHANTFGTDEFIAFTRALSAEALITANVGTGTYEELDDWRKYFDAAGAKVRYWELGNEIYLAEPKRRATIPGNDERIYHTASAYAAKAREWARRLKGSDAGILVGGIAGTYNTSADNRGWLDVLLAEGAADLDFVALHNAFAPLVFGRYDYGNELRRRAAYQAMFGHVEHSGEDSREVKRRWAGTNPQRPARVAITEHFPLFGAGGDQQQLLRILDQSRTLASALFTGSLFHAWMREGVWMATYNLTVSKWFGALVTDTDEGLIKTPTYHVFDLYRNHFGTSLVQVSHDGPAFDAPAVGTVQSRQRVPYLDVVAATGDSDELTVAVICRRMSGTVSAAIDGLPAAAVRVTTLAAATPNAINGPGLTDTVSPRSSVQPRTTTWTYASGQSYTFPANSVTFLQWPPARA